MADVMLGIVILVIIALCAILVYLDATANRIGDISEHRPHFKGSALFWAIGTLFVWPVVFPLYLRLRRQLIEAAVDHPVEENWRALKTGGVTISAVLFIAVSMAVPAVPNQFDLPSCSSSDTIIELLRTLDTSSSAAMIDNDVVEVTKTIEIDYSSDPMVRTCSATVSTSKREGLVRYNVLWADTSTQELRVAAQPVVLY
jgi:hypothetical protein